MKKKKQGFCVTENNLGCTGTSVLLELGDARDVSPPETAEKSLAETFMASDPRFLEAVSWLIPFLSNKSKENNLKAKALRSAGDYYATFALPVLLNSLTNKGAKLENA